MNKKNPSKEPKVLFLLKLTKKYYYLVLFLLNWLKKLKV